jgi:hypothetical protein
MWKSDHSLIVWTAQEARQLRPEQHLPSEVEAKPCWDTAKASGAGAERKPEMKGQLSLSIFTIEVDGKPTLAFEAKR